METPVRKFRTFDIAIAVCLIAIVVSLRLLPHPANFAPVAAAAIFGGAVLPRRLALAVPLAAMIASDLIIGLHDLVLLTWGSYALFALTSSFWLRKLTLLRGATLTISASLFFFVVTNFGVWLTSGMYAHTWAGLVRCYELALPFFRNTLMSDIVYTAVLFGAYGLAIKVGQRLLLRTKADF
ncbi:TPA: hypothetical protein DIS56_00120 [Candidatus Saccharibacteria bacterium]|nr:MAG: hypothetical protein A3F05_02405 [Candidatus Saccharibacteria bacterium RIFCSPHIGHO2_12_FULL_47_17]HCM51534.1 hypothetical protein [Candidatus Saccharibacteria bacterium]